MVTFVSAESSQNRFVCWNERPTPRLTSFHGAAPGDVLALEHDLGPESGFSSPVMRLNSVVLPAPFGPMIAWIAPFADVEA